MLGGTLKQLTETLNKLPSAGRRNGGTTSPNIPENPDDRKAYLEMQAREAEALRLAKLRANIKTAVSTPPICDFIESKCWNAEKVSLFRGQYDFSNSYLIRLAPHQRRILTHILTIDPLTARFPYMTIVYSCPKKSGKTAISGYVGAWFNCYINAPNSVMVLANDRDQAHERAMWAMTPTLVREFGAKVKGDIIENPNGSIVKALTNQPESEAGGHYNLTLWTELWAFNSVRSRSLWAEMMPIRTEPLSLRWVDSYAGYEDKSPLLLELFQEVFTDTTESELQAGARPVPELIDITTTDAKGNVIPCCYEVPEKGIFYYVDHEHRMDWQKDNRYIVQETVGMVETDIQRLIYNRWQKSENKFITETELNDSIKRGFMDLPQSVKKMTFALDGTLRHANAGIVGVYEQETPTGVIFRTGYAKAFDPKGEPIDLEETLGAEVVTLWKAGLIDKREPDAAEKKLVEQGYIPIDVHYDNFQMAQVVLNIKKKHKLLLKEFNQKTERARADTFLQNCYQNGTIDNPKDETLREHLDNAAAEATTSKETSERIRIVQSNPNKWVDLTVCQSMATYRRSQRPRPRKFGSFSMGRAKGLTGK